MLFSRRKVGEDAARERFVPPGTSSVPNPDYWVNMAKFHSKLYRDDLAVDAVEQREKQFECDGDKRLASILRQIRSFAHTPNRPQWVTIWWCIQAALRIIYGKDYDAHARRLFNKFGIDIIHHFVIVVAGRRSGKSYAIATFVAALALGLNDAGPTCLPIKAPIVSIFSAGGKSASWILRHILNFIYRSPDTSAGRRICGNNRMQLYIAARPMEPGTNAGSEAARVLMHMETTMRIDANTSSIEGKFCFIAPLPHARHGHVLSIAATGIEQNGGGRRRRTPQPQSQGARRRALRAATGTKVSPVRSARG